MAEVDRKWVESALQKDKNQFPDMDLSRIDLSYLDFTKCNLHGCNLEGTDLTGAILDKADLSWSKVEGAVFDSIKADKVILYKQKTSDDLTAKKDCTEDTSLADMQKEDDSLESK